MNRRNFLKKSVPVVGAAATGTALVAEVISKICKPDDKFLMVSSRDRLKPVTMAWDPATPGWISFDYNDTPAGGISSYYIIDVSDVEEIKMEGNTIVSLTTKS